MRKHLLATVASVALATSGLVAAPAGAATSGRAAAAERPTFCNRHTYDTKVRFVKGSTSIGISRMWAHTYPGRTVIHRGQSVTTDHRKTFKAQVGTTVGSLVALGGGGLVLSMITAGQGPALWFPSGMAAWKVVFVLAGAPGLVVATWRFVTRWLRAPEAPLVAMAFAGATMLVLHTWTAQSTASVKGSYLLPLAPVAGVFFAQGSMLLRGRWRLAVLAWSLAAAAAAAFVFTEGALFRSVPPGVFAWAVWARKLPGSHIAEALRFFIVSG